MTQYFFDTSAAVKYYHTEAGTTTVSAIFAERDRKLRISSLGLLEIQSSFAMKVRSGALERAAAGIQRARLMLDIAAGDIEVYGVTDDHFGSAARLIGQRGFTRRLRTDCVWQDGGCVKVLDCQDRKKSTTLVLVHRQQLLEQWRARLAVFLNIPLKAIGLVSGGRDKRTGVIDIALLQSLQRKGEVKDFVADYGHIIADECHHLSAFSFEQVMRQAKAKFILGLTATPVRKVGHHPIIFLQCGPIRFNLSAREGCGTLAIRTSSVAALHQL